MKKVFILLAILFISSTTIKAQGIYQLWGMTKTGGADNTGTIFNTDNIGNNFQNRHQFKSYNPGAKPGYTAPVEYNGKLYGMTQNGGNNGLGVIFEWDPVSNIYNKKIDLNTTDGIKPKGSLTINDGKFYGLTSEGGVNNSGVIFEWDPTTNIYTKKIDLNTAGGSSPLGNLTYYGGKFYGMTQYGGLNNVGVIFEWDPGTNVFTKKIDLSTTIGCNPQGSLTFYNGKFFGMTEKGGANNFGVIFEWDPATNIFTDKIDFNYVTGSRAVGNLTLNEGKFYGLTTLFGNGSNGGGGTLFEWDPGTNILIIKHEFSGGYVSVNGSLTICDGKFYGVTRASIGTHETSPRLFVWDPLINMRLDIYSFIKPTGYDPNGILTLSNGKLYGMTTQGGSSNSGVIYEFNPLTNNYTKKIDFNGNDGLFPRSNLSSINGKFYGVTSNGGCDNGGVIFEWDPSSNEVTQRLDFLKNKGLDPSGNLTFYNGKFYGMNKTYIPVNSHGYPAGIYEWDPTTNIYTPLVIFDSNNGRPAGSLILNGGKFYGMTESGGMNLAGAIFEWDPVTNIYTKKIDLGLLNGSTPQGSLTYFGDKYYGMTQYGGANDAGVIFEWDPVTNIYIKKIDFSLAIGSNPKGSLTLYNGKFYGMTELGGINNQGVIFEWDPVTNLYTTKVELNTVNGSNPHGSLTVSSGKFYGMTNSGGANNLGVMFEWDPATNVYTKKKEFSGIDGGNPAIGNDLTLNAAPVANGIAGSCTSFPAVTIDNSNNNIWVPITDNNGDAVAEIKANGNNLGIVSTSAFVNNAAVREDAIKRLYLDRNLTITPQFQPSSTVDIRLYIKGTEYLALKNAVNSIGQPSGILSINDVGIFKNDANCEPAITIAPTPVLTNAATWETNYVLTASINSFSSFYFLNKAQGGPLPVTLLEFKGRLQNYNGEISWQTTDEFNTRTFELERSTDGRIFKPIAEIAAINMPGNHKYNYTDKNIRSLAVPVVYYRLKQIDLDSRFTYTRIIALNIDKDIYVMLYPNPVSDKANLSISLNKPQQVQARIVDNSGKVMIQNTWKLPSGSSLLTIDVSGLAKGMYYLELKGEMITERRKFVK